MGCCSCCAPADPASVFHPAGYWAWSFALAKGFIKKQRKSKLARKRKSIAFGSRNRGRLRAEGPVRYGGGTGSWVLGDAVKSSAHACSRRRAHTHHARARTCACTRALPHAYGKKRDIPTRMMMQPPGLWTGATTSRARTGTSSCASAPRARSHPPRSEWCGAPIPVVLVLVKPWSAGGGRAGGLGRAARAARRVPNEQSRKRGWKSRQLLRARHTLRRCGPSNQA